MPPSTRLEPSSSRTVLALAESQWLFHPSDLLCTPSALDGLCSRAERESRAKGVNFITQVGITLKLPQVTLATASILMHRFYMRHSMVVEKGGFHYYAIAATALFLATKVEENCRKMKELVISCCRVAQKNPNLVVNDMSKEYWRWRDTILHNEDVLLEATCFDLTIEPSYKVFYEMLKACGLESDKGVRNGGWAFLNDSLMTEICLLHSTKIVAAAALYCAVRHCGAEVRVPVSKAENGEQTGSRREPQWWDVLNVDMGEVKQAANFMASLYEDNPPKQASGLYRRTPETNPEDGQGPPANGHAEGMVNKRPHDGDEVEPGTENSVRSDEGVEQERKKAKLAADDVVSTLATNRDIQDREVGELVETAPNPPPAAPAAPKSIEQNLPKTSDPPSKATAVAASTSTPHAGLDQEEEAGSEEGELED